MTAPEGRPLGYARGKEPDRVDVVPGTIAVLLLCLPLGAMAAWAGPRVGVPSPVLLVGAGAILALFPALPVPALAPDVVFFVFLPPLVYYAAYFIAPSDLRASARPVGLLAVGLVVATAAAVAGVVVAVAPQVGVGIAAVIGAVVAPTDTVAATSAFRRLRVPQKIMTVVEGEALINDGVALVLYTTAVSAVAAGAFQPGVAVVALVVAPLGGAVLGWAIAWVLVALRRRLDEPLVEITISLSTPFLTYVLAQALGLSGVLATVVAGLYVGSRRNTIYAATARLQAFAFLDVLVFLLNAVLFTLLGAQLVRELHGVAGLSGTTVVAAVGAVAVTVIVIRLLTLLVLPVWPGPPDRSAEHRRAQAVVGWAGMRGGVSLAAALAVPLLVADGAPFPYRDLVVLAAAVTVLATLVLQGVTLAPLMRRLGVVGEDGTPAARAARAAAAHSALRWLDEHPDADPEGALRRHYAARVAILESSDDGDPDDRGPLPDDPAGRLALLEIERAEIARWHASGRLSTTDLQAIERRMDLEEALLRES